jgi:hypothetical protein
MDATGTKARCVIAVMNRGTVNWTLAMFIWFIFNFRPPSQPGSEAAEQITARTMPRLRGKPRRGAAWYRAEYRRKRISNFKRALALVATRRKHRPSSPPMEIIEEISWEEAQQHLPSLVSTEGSKPSHEAAQWDLNAATAEDLYPPCNVEEEAPPDASIGKEKLAGLASRVAGDSSAQEPNVSGEPDQPPAADFQYLSLIFELRHLMEDHAFRLARLDQHLDMLFAAYSKISPKKQCPTYAQAYSLPARWRQKRNEAPG